MAVRVAAVVVLATGCRGANCEPAITGGTGQQRAEVAAGVSTFFDLLRPDLDLCVPEVEIVPDLEDAWGYYRRRGIELEAGHVWILFHELCHGVQHQNGLRVDAYEPAPESAWSSEEAEPGEVFADLCWLGPGLSTFLDDSCPDDPAGLDRYRETRDLFVGVDPGFVDTDLAAELVPMVDLPTSAATFTLSAGSSGVVVELGDRTLALDPWTGADVPIPTDARPPGDRVETSQGIAWRMAYDTLDGEVGYRWVLDRDRMATLGCADPTHQMFAYDDWLWSARLDGGRFTLGVWLLQ